MPGRQLQPESWNRLHELLRVAEGGLRRLTPAQLDELGLLYRVAAADLAYLRTHQPDSVWVDRLNSLLVRAYGHIYGDRTGTLRQAWHYMAHTLPMQLKQQAGFMALATGLYLAGFAFGFGTVLSGHAAILSSLIPANFRSTGQHLHQTGGLRVSLLESPALSSAIMTHNITISLEAFATGLALGLPTAFFMAFNGLLLGTLAAEAQTHGATLLFWSLILPHGVFELPATWAAGAAGFLLTAALVAPGDLSRRDALALRGRQALGLLAATLGLLVVAGLIEGFVTPSGLSPWAKLAVAALGLALLTTYLLWPRRPEKEVEL